jgi:transcriptional regulator with XRE-family HTH domain
MKPSDLLKLILAKGLTRAAFAEMIGRDERTVRRWLSGASPIPPWVQKIVK